MKRNNVYFEWFRVYGWATLVTILIVVSVYLLGVFSPEKFNPELHNCTEWKDGVNGNTLNCVSWQLKEKVYVVEINETNYSVTERKLSELYCHDNPSSEMCECVKTEDLTKNVTGFQVDKWEITRGCSDLINGRSTLFKYNDTFRQNYEFASRGDALDVYNNFWGMSSSAIYPDIDFGSKNFTPNAIVCFTKALNAYGKETNRTLTMGKVCVEAVPK